ncbi:replication initiator [Catellatospora sp. TT07R-123]|uniref:replication initiator n=1 Tax=Catellatospora sp. TT07R-123 TaxID=2733863 RepID=UPI001FD3E709|nr:replication initiator [Catellatospora sp. TT07R-123]
MPIARDVLKGLAENNGVCVNPMPFRRTDLETGRTEVVDIPCRARLASKCKPCAERERRLRRQQIREGWHLDDEPAVPVELPADDVIALVTTRAHLEFDRAALAFEQLAPAERAAQLADIDAAAADIDEQLATCRIRGALVPNPDAVPKRVRSTRRRADAVDLPKLPVEAKTVGRVYRGRDGKTHRPSTLLTLTLGSHGAVHSAHRRGNWVAQCECGRLHADWDPLIGTPVDPDSYDYRRAALDAIHFARVLDRFWQNLRRAAGWNVQYAGAVELQKRFAPHAHFAVRGTVPRALMRQVAAATYHQVWWPHFDQPVYDVGGKVPVWNVEVGAYCDPHSGAPLATWQAALDALDDEDATPADVIRLGRVDARGIEHGTKDAERAIRYVTKYLTKDLVDATHARTDPQQAHFDRLHAELSVLPCSPTCSNWLLYGVQPDGAKPGLTPGRCAGKVHQRTTLGFTGRRVLVSRQWSGKTLADHRADNRAWVRTVLAGALADDETPQPEDTRRFTFERARPEDPDVDSLAVRLMRSISERRRWHTELEHARTTALPTSTAQLTLAA